MAHRSCSIELRHLRYFIAAADHGSFRKAGVALQITESAISRRIRDLEDGIGVSLFTRHNGGVRVTAAGRQLLTTAIGALDQVEQVSILTAAYLKDPTDPQWAKSPDMIAWNQFMDKYYPTGDKTSTFPVYAYAVSSTLVEVLKRAGDNLTREKS